MKMQKKIFIIEMLINTIETITEKRYCERKTEF